LCTTNRQRSLTFGDRKKKLFNENLISCAFSGWFQRVALIDNVGRTSFKCELYDMLLSKNPAVTGVTQISKSVREEKKSAGTKLFCFKIFVKKDSEV
jgi:hypothetical protein